MYKQFFDALFSQRKYLEAELLVANVVAKNASDIDAWWALAQARLAQGKAAEAVDALYQVCQKKTAYFVPAIELLVKTCVENKLWNDGVAPAEELVKLRPENLSARLALIDCYVKSGRYRSPIEHIEQSLKIQPGNEYEVRLVQCLFWCGFVDRSIEQANIRLESHSSDHFLQRVSASFLNYVSGVSDEKVFQEHLRFGESIGEYESRFERKMAGSGEKKSIAIYSKSFRRHSVTYFLAPLIEHLDKDHWNVVLIKENADNDEVSEYFAAHSSQVIESFNLSDEELVARLEELNLDVFIDLEGLMVDLRVVLFKKKIAPLYLTYLGYPNTTGIKSIDYRLTDDLVDVRGKAEAYHSEKLAYLRNGFLCYRPSVTVPDINPLNAKEITFGSFNACEKITKEQRAVWATILNQVPNSRLIIKSKAFGDDLFKAELKMEFQQMGVDPSRIEVLDYSPHLNHHLNIYGSVDIHLDTYPYTGTTTTFEALWQGVPTLTLVGNAHRSRVTYSINERIGLAAFNAFSEEEYVQKAVRWAENIKELRDMRLGHRDRLRNSCFMDEKGFVKDFENLVESLIEEKRLELIES